MVKDAMVELKICSRKDCQHRGEPQPISNFSREKRWRNGYRSQCKDCVRAYQKAYNHSPGGKARNALKDARYRQSLEGKVHIKAHSKTYQQKPEAKALRTHFRQSPKAKATRIHYDQSPQGRITNTRARQCQMGKLYYKVNHSIRTGISISLRGNKNGHHWESLVGYTILDLTRRLEALFTDGMTWDNYGKWHIDHIIPLSAFNFSSADDYDFKKCWALSNLQPLWQAENLRKHNKVDFIAREIVNGNNDG